MKNKINWNRKTYDWLADLVMVMDGRVDDARHTTAIAI